MNSEDHSGPTGRFSSVARALSPYGFPIIYLGWAFLFWTPVILSDESVWSSPNVFLFIIGGLSPLLAGLLLAWLTRGRDGLADLGNRLVEFRRIPLQWVGIILLFWPVFNLFVGIAGILLGTTANPLDLISTERLFDPVATVSLVAFAFLFPAVEEVGLRGYWLDQLQERWSALVAGLINGTTWAIWHAPFVLFTGYYANTTFDPELWWWLPSIVLGTIIYVWVYNNTNRSILAVLCFHAFGNMTGEVMGFTPEMYPFILTGYVVVALFVIVLWSPQSLRGWGTSRPQTKRRSA